MDPAIIVDSQATLTDVELDGAAATNNVLKRKRASSDSSSSGKEVLFSKRAKSSAPKARGKKASKQRKRQSSSSSKSSSSSSAQFDIEENAGDVLKLGISVRVTFASPIQEFLRDRAQIVEKSPRVTKRTLEAIAAKPNEANFGKIGSLPKPCNVTNIAGGGHILPQDNGRFFVSDAEVDDFCRAWTQTLLGNRVAAISKTMLFPYDTRRLCLNQHLVAPVLCGASADPFAALLAANTTSQEAGEVSNSGTSTIDSVSIASGTIIFPMVLDLDNVGELDFAKEHFHYLISVIIEATRACFPTTKSSLDFRCVVTQTIDSERMTKNTVLGKSSLCRGVHIHFPKLLVNPVMAIHLCAYIKHVLMRNHTNDQFASSLGKCLDFAIYKRGSGVSLRMVGFPKPPKCPTHHSATTFSDFAVPETKTAGGQVIKGTAKALDIAHAFGPISALASRANAAAEATFTRSCKDCIAITNGVAPQGRHWAVAVFRSAGNLAVNSKKLCANVSVIVRYCNLLLPRSQTAAGVSQGFAIPERDIQDVNSLISIDGLPARLLYSAPPRAFVGISALTGSGSVCSTPRAFSGNAAANSAAPLLDVLANIPKIRGPAAKNAMLIFVGEKMAIAMQNIIRELRPDLWRDILLKSEWFSKNIFTHAKDKQSGQEVLTRVQCQERYQEWRIELELPCRFCEQREDPLIPHNSACIYFVVNRKSGITCHCYAASCLGSKQNLEQANSVENEKPRTITRHSLSKDLSETLFKDLPAEILAIHQSKDKLKKVAEDC